MVNNVNQGRHGCSVITVCSGKGGAGKTTVVRTLIELFKKDYRIAVIDGAVGLAGISSIYGAYPTPGRGYEEFLRGMLTASELVYPVDGIKLIPSGFTAAIKDTVKGRDVTRIDELIDHLKMECDLIVIDASSGIDPCLYQYLINSNIILIVVTLDPQSVTDGYALAKSSLTMVPLPAVSYFLNMVMADDDYAGFNAKMHLLSGKFLNREMGAMGYLKFDAFFMKSPGPIEFRSMIGNENRNNLEEFRRRFKELLIPNSHDGLSSSGSPLPILSRGELGGSLSGNDADGVCIKGFKLYQTGGEV